MGNVFVQYDLFAQTGAHLEKPQHRAELSSFFFKSCIFVKLYHMVYSIHSQEA